MTKNLSLTLATIAKSTAQAMVEQQMSLNSLANMVFDNRIAFGYLPADKDVCASVKTFYCSWINTQTWEISKEATWLE